LLCARAVFPLRVRADSEERCEIPRRPA
jgi:hypothetical protein